MASVSEPTARAVIRHAAAASGAARAAVRLASPDAVPEEIEEDDCLATPSLSTPSTPRALSSVSSSPPPPAAVPPPPNGGTAAVAVRAPCVAAVVAAERTLHPPSATGRPLRGAAPKPRKVVPCSVSAPALVNRCPAVAAAVPLPPAAEASASRGGPIADARHHRVEPRVRLREEELAQLPVGEALRHVLIHNAGGLKQAYDMMDVKGDGWVNQQQFELGLARLNVRSIRVPGFDDGTTLFRTFNTQGDRLSLQEMLCYFPCRATSRRFRDTGFQLCEYANRAAQQRSCLARPPRWKTELGEKSLATPTSKILGEDPDLQEQRRRDLRKKLRDMKGNAPACGKRALVAGLVDPESYADVKLRERNEAIVREKRIKGAIEGCHRARSDLVGLQQVMKLINPSEQKVRIAVGTEVPAAVTKKELEQRRQSSVLADLDVSNLLNEHRARFRRASAAYFPDA